MHTAPKMSVPQRDRPTSAPIRRAKIPELLAQPGANPLPPGVGQGGSDGDFENPRRVYVRPGPASSRLRPASARASLQRPGSASGRQPVYILDHDHLAASQPTSARATPQVRGSFGAWQGKKFAMIHTSEPNEAAVQFAGLQGTRTRLERPKSAAYQAQHGGGAGTCDLHTMQVGGRTVRRIAGQQQRTGGHASLLDASSRRAMLDKIRANNLRQEELKFEGTNSAQAFVPRLRPRSATVRLSLGEVNVDEATNSHRTVFRSPRGASGRSRSPAQSRSPVRGPDGGLRVDLRAQRFRPEHMLVDLSLPSVSEADVEHTLSVPPVRDALSGVLLLCS
jgi:hypothetical protein